MSDLIGEPKERISHAVAQIRHTTATVKTVLRECSLCAIIFLELFYITVVHIYLDLVKVIFLEHIIF